MVAHAASCCCVQCCPALLHLTLSVRPFPHVCSCSIVGTKTFASNGITNFTSTLSLLNSGISNDACCAACRGAGFPYWQVTTDAGVLSGLVSLGQECQCVSDISSTTSGTTLLGLIDLGDSTLGASECSS